MPPTPPSPLAYFIAIATHGCRLQGREVLPADDVRDDSPYSLDSTRRRIVMETLREVCEYRGWTLWAARVRSDCAYSVVSADVRPERVIRDFKAYAGRRLKKQLREPMTVKRWAKGGCVFGMFDHVEIRAEVAFTLEGKDDQTESFDGSTEAKAGAARR